MSADRLRAAASLLRERAGAATPGPWVARGNDVEHFFPRIGEYGIVAEAAPEYEAAYIATMSPPVALALADWLDDIALTWELADGNMADPDGDPMTFAESIDSHAGKVSDAIVGGQS